MRRLAAIGCITLAACSSSVGLSVDLRTDYAPGAEFSAVQTEVARMPFASPAPTGMVVPSLLHAGAAYTAGVRVAELPDVGTGDFYVRVSLVGATGAIVASRVTAMHITGSYALTSVISHTCGGITCPRAADNPAFTACNAGHCVDPRCAPAAPEYCGTSECVHDTDCTTHGECAHATCASGVCLVAPDSARCTGGATCALDFHCGAAMDGGPPDLGPRTDLGPPVDLGPGCPAHETSCANGADDDCDGMIDCADADCTGTPCDDGNACTSGDACGGGTCAGAAVSCPSDTCVMRTCNGSATCTVANAADGTGCADDGNPCTADVCSSGGCIHLALVADNTQWGANWNERCCGGHPVDIAADDGNCGVCGNSCGGMGCAVYFPYWSECRCTHDGDCRGTCYDGVDSCPASDGAGYLCQCQNDSDCFAGQNCCMYGPAGCRHICKWGC